MNFTEAVSSGFSNYVNFSGRARRSEYWYWTLFVLLVTIAANVLDNVATFGLASLITGFGLLLPGLAISIRRLHDLDRTGWWFLLVFTVVGAIVLIIFACTKGTDGPNRYGPDPLAGQVG
jgi:uncharacterized membrane protein YhaH (DUF805 family)